MRWTVGLGLLLGPGCADLSGEWTGSCDYEAGARQDREVKLVVTLRELADNGLGKGNGKIVDEDSVRAEVVYLHPNDETVSIDLYPDEGKYLFLRGQLRDGRIVGSCGDEEPETYNIDAALDCAQELDSDCDEATEWAPGKRPAPVSDDDLSGRFTLRRQ
jgi:hypothetical protein